MPRISASSPRFNLNVDTELEHRRAELSSKIAKFLEDQGVKFPEISGVLAFTAATVCYTMSCEPGTRTCIDRQGMMFLNDFLFYLDGSHAMKIEEQMEGHEETFLERTPEWPYAKAKGPRRDV